MDAIVFFVAGWHGCWQPAMPCTMLVKWQTILQARIVALRDAKRTSESDGGSQSEPMTVRRGASEPDVAGESPQNPMPGSASSAPLWTRTSQRGLLWFARRNIAGQVF